MARRTYDDIDGFILTRIGNRSEATSDLREQWINDALVRVAHGFVHPSMQGVGTETLLATTDSITPSSITDLFAPRVVKRDGGQIIHPTDAIEEVENISAKPAGIPSRYYWWGGVFYFDRKPASNTTIRIWYRKKPTRWTTGNSVLDEAYDYILESLAVHNALNFFREYEKAQLALGQAQQYVRDMALPVFDARRGGWNAGIQVRSK